MLNRMVIISHVSHKELLAYLSSDGNTFEHIPHQAANNDLISQVEHHSFAEPVGARRWSFQVAATSRHS